jgi:1A family penicillin-binding protein
MFLQIKVFIIEFIHDIWVAIHRLGSNLKVLAGAIIVIVGCVFAFLVGLQLLRVPDLKSLRYYHGADSVQIYDIKDQLVVSVPLGGGRIMVPLSQVPKHVQLAILAAEDHRFYEHTGLDFAGMLRATLTDLQSKRLRQGGSTITQQLVKNLFFSDEKRSFDRKIAESLVAVDIEKRYSKDEILSMYLNEIYFGNNANGIEQGALRYFGKDVSQLSLPEGAFLAGLIRAPSYYGAPEHRQEAFYLQWQVLDAMVDDGFINEQQCQLAKRTILSFKTINTHMVDHPFNRYPYYVSFVLDFVRNRFTDAQIRRDGLKVYTNLDTSAQEIAERTLAKEIVHAPRGVTSEALIATALKDASIRAIVGGAHDYWRNQWNSATNPHTVGSTFKPFVYLAGFLNGSLSPYSTIEDTPLKIRMPDGKIYSPGNYDHKYMGRITVKQALAQSRNVCAVRAAQIVGIGQIVATARQAGIQSDLPPTLSLALGSAAISPLELAGAYGTFARGGMFIRPWAVRRVENRSGQTLLNLGPLIYRAFDERPVCELIDILREVVEHGTGTQAKLGDRPVAGKTGTADQARDIWFVGFTPDMVTAVWGGNDQNLPIPGSNVTGGSVMAHVFREFNRAYYAKNPQPAGHLFTNDSYAEPTPIPARTPPVEPHRATQPRPVRPRHHEYYATVPKVVPRQTYQEAPQYDYGTVIRRQKGLTEYVWTR